MAKVKTIALWGLLLIAVALLLTALTLAVVTAPRIPCPDGTTQTTSGRLNSHGEPVAEGHPDR